MINGNALLDVISRYKKSFYGIHKNEIYKWKAVKCFHDYWDVNADNFPEMLGLALSKANNLLFSQNFYPKAMICEMAEKDPETVRTMFLSLFDETLPVVERIEKFILNAEELRQEYGGGSWKSHYQTTNSVSVYLFFRYPEKYYIFKYRKFKDFADKISYPNVPKMGKVESVQSYYDMCNEILKIARQDSELVEISKNRLTSDDYADEAFHLLIEDIVFFGSKQENAATAQWWPNESEYTPGIEKELWIQLLNNPNIFTPDALAIMKRLSDAGGEATCKQLSQKYGESPNFYNTGSSRLAKRVWQATDCKVKNDDNENAKWWPILYVGKHVNKNTPGIYMWKLRPELSEALKEIDLSAIPLYGQTPDNNTEGINYWWLNANPKIWSFSNIRIGEE